MIEHTRGMMTVSAAIDKIADSGVSLASDLFDVTQRISDSDVAAKITGQEAVALAGALLDTGSNAELAATSIQRLIMKMNDAEVQEGFARTIGVGVGVEHFSGLVADRPIDAIQAFLDAIEKLDAQGQGIALDNIGIVEPQDRVVIRKLAQQTDALTRYLELVNSEFVTLDQLASGRD